MRPRGAKVVGASTGRSKLPSVLVGEIEKVCEIKDPNGKLIYLD
jgi:hypothetical protein